MATVVNISKQALQTLVDQKKTIEEMAKHFSAPQSKIKEGIKYFDIKIPRASKGGVVFNFIDEEATFTMSETPKPVLTAQDFVPVVTQEEELVEADDNVAF
jgi:hypothetical protein